MIASRRARRALVWSVAAFVCTQIGLSAWIESDAGLPARDPEFACRFDRLRERIAERPGADLTVFLGSSRVCYGVKAGELCSPERLAFNFALPGSGPHLQRVVFDRMIDSGIRPENVIVEVMPLMLSTPDGERMEDQMLDGARLAWDELPVRSPDPRMLPVRRYLAARLLPIHRHQSELRESIGVDRFGEGFAPRTPADEVDAWGWVSRMGESTPEQRQGLRGLAERQYKALLRDFRADPTTVARYDELFGRVRAAGIGLELLIMPESARFRSLRSGEAEERWRVVVEKLETAAGSRVIDLSAALASDELFYDGHHLLPEGAVATTRFLPSPKR